MNWALRINARQIEKDLESALNSVLGSKINKEYILNKTTDKLHHRKKMGDFEGSFSPPPLSVQIVML